jgi:hypothetical protein
MLRRVLHPGPAQPSPTIEQYLNGGLGWLEVECCPLGLGSVSPPNKLLQRVPWPPLPRIE